MKNTRHIISVADFSSTTELRRLFERVQFYKEGLTNVHPPLKNLLGLLLFYEPSTRTRLSFESAIARLGGVSKSTDSAGQFSSAAKGETLEDTIRVVSGMYHFIILRHPENGAAERAARVASVPVINAGDGSNEHPTQALLDLFTIWEAVESGRLPGKNLRLLFLGDTGQSRAVTSLIRLWHMHAEGLHITTGASIVMPHNDTDVIDSADVIYITRIQRERYPDDHPMKTAKPAVFGLEHLSRMKPNAIIMHPLPRVDELAHEVDVDERAWYFKQSQNGLFVRMALLEWLLCTDR